MDVKYDVAYQENSVDAECECGNKGTSAYTTPFPKNAIKGQTSSQLCPHFLKSVGQTHVLNAEGRPQNKNMHDSVRILAMGNGRRIHIDHYAGLELTLFHEVCFQYLALLPFVALLILIRIHSSFTHPKSNILGLVILRPIGSHVQKSVVLRPLIMQSHMRCSAWVNLHNL